MAPIETPQSEPQPENAADAGAPPPLTETSDTAPEPMKTPAKAGFVEPEPWQITFRADVDEIGEKQVFASHKNAAALTEAFNVGAYIEQNQDILAVVVSPAEAIFHYLEYGLDEGRAAVPTEWSPEFVRKNHGLSLTETLTPVEANAQLMAAGIRLSELILVERQLWTDPRASAFEPAKKPDDSDKKPLEAAPKRQFAKGEVFWQGQFRLAAHTDGVDRLLGEHKNAKALTSAFNVGAYLESNADVFDSVSSSAEAAFHYLEFGFAEDRVAAPISWSPTFVRQYHGITLSDDLSAREANARLRAMGVPLQDAFLTETHLWLVNNVWGAYFEPVFEHSFYAAAAEAAGAPLEKTDRLSAIKHFCEIGIDLGLPPHPSYRFEAAFYRDGLLAAPHVEPPEDISVRGLRRHWAKIGVRAGVHANPQALFTKETNLHLPDVIVDSIAKFQAASPGLPPNASLPMVLHHLIYAPKPGASRFDLRRDDVVAFISGLAQACRSRGDTVNAEWLLSLILSVNPLNSRARLDLADLIFPENRINTELQLRNVIPADFDVGSNQITLAERLFVEDRWQDSLEAAEAIPETYASDVTLTARRYNLAETLFGARWNNLYGALTRSSVPQVQEDLSRALALMTRSAPTPNRSEPIQRVAVLANDDLYQCKLYRADQKIDHLRAAGFEASLYVQSRDVARLKEDLHNFDAVIFMRSAAFPHIIDLITCANEQGLATFYDCDDLIFDADLFPPPLETYSGNITKDEHEAIACGVPLFRHAMSLCDYGISSTPTITTAMEKVVRTGKVFLHRNALSLIHLRAVNAAPEKKSSGKLVLYYGSGTKAHKEEFHDILEPALAEVLEARRGQVEVRIIGEFSDLSDLDPSDPDVRLISPIWDFEAFCQEVAQADINLSVLTPTPITDAKSEIKWMEAAMFGIPSVVTPTATHVGVVEEGKTGFLRSDKDGFVEALLMLIDDADRRASVGSAARDYVMDAYGIEAMGKNFAAMFEEIRPKRETPKQRLMIVNVFYPPQDIGGATRVVQDNVRDLVDRYGDKYDIDVVCSLEGGTSLYDVKPYSTDGVRVWAITADPTTQTMDEKDHKMRDVFDELLERLKPDLVHFHCIQRLTASIVDATWLRGIPYTITLHDGWWISPNQFIAAPDGELETYDFAGDLSARARVTGRGLRDASARLAVSEGFAKVHRDVGVADVEVTENGLSRLPAMVRTEPSAGRVRVGHIGGASRHKGFSLLRAAVESQRYENIDLVILDHALPLGEKRSEVWNGTPVTLLPRLPLHRVGEVYGQIDVLLAPSTWPESYGLVTREALALGLWVVASDMGGIGQDVEEGKNGHIVSVQDHKALAACLARIDGAPETYGKPTGYPFTPRSVAAQVDELVAIYDRILTKAPASK